MDQCGVEIVERIAGLQVVDVKRLVAPTWRAPGGGLTGKFRAQKCKRLANLLPTPKPPTSPLETKFQVGANW